LDHAVLFFSGSAHKLQPAGVLLPEDTLNQPPRLRSQMALYEKLRGMDVWKLGYLEPLIEAKNFAANSKETRMFVHAANMLNAVTEEISYGTIYKAEGLTTDANILGH
jgi:hypothetical protein